MRRALDDAGSPRLGYVHAHATGTAQGDASELHALDALCAARGLRELPVSSHKGAIGHLFHASAFPALAACIEALRRGVAPPTVGLREPLETRYVLLPTSPVVLSGAEHALINSFGFSGNITSLVLAAV